MNYDLTNPNTVIFGQKLADADARRTNLQGLVQELIGQTSAPSTTYKGINFEQPAYREGQARDKALLTYDQSLKRLRDAGFERHAQPQEVFSLLIDGLEGKLDAAGTAIKEDMLTSYGEWLSLVFERQGDKLICYLDPEGLVWNGSEYIKTPDFKFSTKAEFDIPGISSGQFVELAALPEGFARFIYGKPANELPQEMRTGNRRAGGYFPANGKVRPVGRGSFVDGRFNVFDYFSNRASRGIALAPGLFYQENTWV